MFFIISKPGLNLNENLSFSRISFLVLFHLFTVSAFILFHLLFPLNLTG
ncbi:hypothetical protein HOLDEFILI_03166 [Holdemania filiformis DSM 12042]|uniref:Uncharacterized protein n=1 Tax=Holdemania filiformis DSM 12042 TaxID=545696 RepID=B9YBF9_9FIRM|nr:hypothetical protein HOLDEFILI_03166 [Holdemania filiformis DSM 12042]